MCGPGQVSGPSETHATPQRWSARARRAYSAELSINSLATRSASSKHTMQTEIDDSHPFAGPDFIVFPHAKREQIRQALLDAHQVYRLQHLLGANVCGLTFSHEIGGRLYTIEMHRNKDNLWQMRVPRASKSFVLLNEDLYLTYLRESDDALGNVVTKRTLWRLHAARVAASG